MRFAGENDDQRPIAAIHQTNEPLRIGQHQPSPLIRSEAARKAQDQRFFGRHIRMQTAPYVRAGDRCWVRDKTRLGWREIDHTDAWHDDDGHADYLLECRLLDVPPKRTRATAI